MSTLECEKPNFIKMTKEKLRSKNIRKSKRAHKPKQYGDDFIMDDPTAPKACEKMVETSRRDSIEITSSEEEPIITSGGLPPLASLAKNDNKRSSEKISSRGSPRRRLISPSPTTSMDIIDTEDDVTLRGSTMPEDQDESIFSTPGPGASNTSPLLRPIKTPIHQTREFIQRAWKTRQLSQEQDPPVLAESNPLPRDAEQRFERFLLGEDTQVDSNQQSGVSSTGSIFSPLITCTPLSTLVRMSALPDDESENPEQKITLLQQQLVKANKDKAKIEKDKNSLESELQDAKIQCNLLIEKQRKLTTAQATRKKQAVKLTNSEDSLRRVNVELEEKYNQLSEEKRKLQKTVETLKARKQTEGPSNEEKLRRFSDDLEEKVNLLTEERKRLQETVESLESKQRMEKQINEKELHRHSNNLEEKVNLLADEKSMLQGTVESLKSALEEMKALNKDSVKKMRTSIRAFRGQNDPLSNFYYVGYQQLQYKGRGYASSEQAYQHTKALFHGAKQLAKDIMHEGNPVGIKDLGRKIHESKAWSEQKVDIMYEILTAKAACSVEFRLALKEEDPQVTFVEAVYDSFWGSGLPYLETCSTSAGKWPGANMMGKLLSKIRGNLQSIPEPKHAHTVPSREKPQSPLAAQSMSPGPRQESKHTHTVPNRERPQSPLAAQPMSLGPRQEPKHAHTVPNRERPQSPIAAQPRSPGPWQKKTPTASHHPRTTPAQARSKSTLSDTQTTTQRLQRAEQVITETRPTQKVDILVGDSTIRYIQLSTEVKAEKYIMGGSLIENLAERLPHIVAGAEVDKLILGIGANNIPIDSTDEMRQKYCDLLFKTKEIIPDTKVYILGLHHRADHQSLSSKTSKMNNILPEICASYGVVFIPNQSDPTKKGILSRDGLHPSRYGARLATNSIAQYAYHKSTLPSTHPFLHTEPHRVGDRLNNIRQHALRLPHSLPGKKWVGQSTRL